VCASRQPKNQKADFIGSAHLTTLSIYRVGFSIGRIAKRLVFNWGDLHGLPKPHPDRMKASNQYTPILANSIICKGFATPKQKKMDNH